MDIYTYIVRDHRKLAGLMDDLMSIRLPAVRQILFDQIRTELSAHSDSEERTFYAALEHALPTQEMNEKLEQSEHEHHEIKALLHVLGRLSISTEAWMEKFGDPGFEYHATSGRIGAAVALRMANADILPYDYVEFARTMKKYVAPVERGMTQKKWNTAPVAGLTAAIAKLESAAAAFATARDAALAGTLTKAQKDATNAALLTVERSFARDAGLKSRPWYRSMIYASDVDNGYSTMVFPGVGEAIRYGTEADVNAEIADLVARFDAATAAVEKARTALGAR